MPAFTSERRQFLRLVAGAAALGTATRTARAAAPLLTRTRDPRIRAVAFESIVPGFSRELCETWRVRLFEYSWIRSVAGAYRDFHALAEDALTYAARAHGVTLSGDARQGLVAAYQRLAPWPDARAALRSMRGAGLRLAPLTNFTRETTETLLANAALGPLFDAVISTDQAKTFKPDPRAYALGPTVLGLRREEIAFAAFAGWDAAGAKWFGYPTFWVNRLGVPAEELPPSPDAVGATLGELAAWVVAR
jgi:2-haloacid dehalogenase